VRQAYRSRRDQEGSFPGTLSKEPHGYLHSDSVVIEGADRGKYSHYPSVEFEHFYGISPRRYRELFERSSRKTSGRFVEWKDGVKQPIVDLKFPFYLSLEAAILKAANAYLEKIKMPIDELS
jgi:hypothetical protein